MNTKSVLTALKDLGLFHDCNPSFVIKGGNRVIWFFFDTSRGSRFVTKEHSINKDFCCKREFTATVAIRSIVNERIRESIPKQWVAECGGEQLLVERFMVGRQLRIPIERGSWSQFLAPAAAWLIEFQRCQQLHSMTTNNDTLRSEVDRAVNLAISNNASNNINDIILSLAYKFNLRLSRSPIPRLWAHGDFTPSNLLFENGVVSGVVDWELSRSDESPFYDWFRFLIIANSIIRKTAPERKSDFMLEALRSWLSWIADDTQEGWMWTTRLLEEYDIPKKYTILLLLLFLDKYAGQNKEARITMMTELMKFADVNRKILQLDDHSPD